MKGFSSKKKKKPVQGGEEGAIDLTGMGSSPGLRRRTLTKRGSKVDSTDSGTGYTYGGNLTGMPPSGQERSSKRYSKEAAAKKLKKKKKREVKKENKVSLREQLSQLNQYVRSGVLSPDEYRDAAERAVGEADALDIAGITIPTEVDSSVPPTIEAVIDYVGNPENIAYAAVAPVSNSRSIPDAVVVSDPGFVVDASLIERIDNLNSENPTSSSLQSAVSPPGIGTDLPAVAATSDQNVDDRKPSVTHPLLQIGKAGSMTNLVGLGDDDDADDVSRKDLSEEESFALLMGSVSVRDDDGQKPDESSKETEENQQAIELQTKSTIAPGTAVARSKETVPEEDIKPSEAAQEISEPKETVVDLKKQEDEEQHPEVNEEPKKNRMIQRMLSAPISFVGVGEADDDTGDANELDDADLLLNDMDMGFNLNVVPESVTTVKESLKPTEKKVSEPALEQQPQPVEKENPVEEQMIVKPQPVKKAAQKPVQRMKYDPVAELSRLERSMSSREEPSSDEEVRKKGKRKKRSKGATKPLMLRGESAVLFDVDDDDDGLKAPAKPEQSYNQSDLYYESDSDEEPQLDSLYNGGDIYKNRMANIQESEAPKTKQMIINEIVSSRGSFRQHYLNEIVEQIEGSGKSIAEKLFTVNFLKDHGSLNYPEFEYVKGSILGRF